MSTNARNHSKVRHAVLWLSTRELYVGLRGSDDSTIEIDYVEWNPDSLVLHTEEARTLLTSALQTLVRKYSLHRLRMRLCLDDALCVTRVAMGERESVDRELESIQSRSQLYLSLGLGEKVTGNLRQSIPGQVHYALTSIVNQRTMLAICESIRAARISLDAIEPVTLSITRAFGFLGLDSSQPILFATVDQNQCILAISRGGKPMLSYQINGQSEASAWAKQIASHLVRLRRFCQRYRLQDRSPLECIYVLGNSEQVAAMTDSLQATTDRLSISSTDLLAEGMFASHSAVPRIVELACWGVLEAEEHRSDGLPPPDLHDQLLKLQTKPLGVQLVRAFCLLR